MCNRYASDIRKAGRQREQCGFDEWSETRIMPIPETLSPKSVGPVIAKRDNGALEWRAMRWGLAWPGEQ